MNNEDQDEYFVSFDTNSHNMSQRSKSISEIKKIESDIINSESFHNMSERKSKKHDITFIVPEIVNKINLIKYYNKNSLLELDPRKISTFEQYRKNDVSTKNGIALLKAICTIKKKDNNFLNELKNVNEEGGIFEPIQKSAEAIRSLAEDLPGCIGEQVNKTMEVQNAIKKTFDSLRELVTNVSKFFIQDIKINKKISIIMGFVSIIFIYKLVSIYLKKNNISPETKNNINNDFLQYLREKDFKGAVIDALNIKDFKLKYDDLTLKWKNYSINNDSVRWAYAFFSSSAVSLISFFSKELFFASKYLFQTTILKYIKQKKSHEEYQKEIKEQIKSQLQQLNVFSGIPEEEIGDIKKIEEEEEELGKGGVELRSQIIPGKKKDRVITEREIIILNLKNLLFNKNKMSVIISLPFILWVMLRYLKYDEKIIDFFYNVGLKTKNVMTNSSLFIFEKISLGGSKIKLSLSPLLKPAYCFSLLFFPYVLFIKLAEQYEISDLEKEFLHGGNLFTFREYISYQLKKNEEKEEEENKSKIKKNFDNESSEENLIDFSNKSYKELIEDFSLNYKIIISDKFFPDISFDPENDFDVKIFELCMYCKSLWKDIVELKEKRKEEYLNYFNSFKELMNECLNYPVYDLEKKDLDELIDKIKDIINNKKYQDLEDLKLENSSEKLIQRCDIMQSSYNGELS